jgi:chemotaxis protein methyltransferase CheR
VSAALRQLIAFRPLNLLSPELPFHGKFDAIFCRNVLIYFDDQTRQTLIRRLREHLVPSGYLFLGLSEGLVQIPAGLSALGQSIYQRTERTAAETPHELE